MGKSASAAASASPSASAFQCQCRVRNTFRHWIGTENWFLVKFWGILRFLTGLFLSSATQCYPVLTQCQCHSVPVLVFLALFPTLFCPLSNYRGSPIWVQKFTKKNEKSVPWKINVLKIEWIWVDPRRIRGESAADPRRIRGESAANPRRIRGGSAVG